MIRIEVDGGIVRFCADSSDGFQIAKDFVFAARGVYDALSRPDTDAAEAFRYLPMLQGTNKNRLRIRVEISQGGEGAMTVQLGDTVKRRPLTFSGSIDADAGKKLVEGRVIYIHPRGRFHVVEFPIARRGASPGLTAGVRETRRGVRESFAGVEK